MLSRNFGGPAVANPALRGETDLSAALIQQYINFADNEILPPSCVWVFPTLGLQLPNQEVSTRLLAVLYAVYI